jgi:hypothetical protein
MGEEILLPCGPVQSVTSVVYVDTAGVSQTLVVTTDYVVDTSAEPARIYPAYGCSWPSARSQPNAITVTYVAGYGLAGANVPEPLLDAMYLLIGDGYEFKQTVIALGGLSAIVPVTSRTTYEALIAQYRNYVDELDELASDVVTGAPALEPILLADARTYLGIPAGFTTRDAEITRLIKAARMSVEHDSGKAMITQTRALKLDAWPEAS